MLEPRTTNQRKGLDALLDAGRPDLTVEAIVLQPRFASLFTAAELAEAAQRLSEYGKQALKGAEIENAFIRTNLNPALST